MNNWHLCDYLEELEPEREYDGYFYSVAQAITIVILGHLYGLKNPHQIWLWASHDKVKIFLEEKFQNIGAIHRNFETNMGKAVNGIITYPVVV